ncbi:MAG: hypothetical protein WCL14_07920, partial [Bacteroidota bacterium]
MQDSIHNNDKEDNKEPMDNTRHHGLHLPAIDYLCQTHKNAFAQEDKLGMSGLCPTFSAPYDVSAANTLYIVSNTALKTASTNHKNTNHLLHVSSAILHVPSAILHVPSAILHVPSAILHVPSAILHVPSAIL